ncbi:hypothetical protein NQ314_021160 [Rhamnusium bicolor]|uniref:Uncharacterized protein n=1 Tax=Rhamnusium bicolor TaxID=1586634 RepID=A0AAV8WIQ7_9CUCU|nr:hypothetical protein NQ314_021160 [Rhamnusium bicolor]
MAEACYNAWLEIMLPAEFSYSVHGMWTRHGEKSSDKEKKVEYFLTMIRPSEIPSLFQILDKDPLEWEDDDGYKKRIGNRQRTQSCKQFSREKLN